MRSRGSPMSAVRWWALCLPLAGIACSGATGLNPVEGKVLYKKGPVKGAAVTFHPKAGDPIKAIRPTGFTKDDGTFTLTTGDREGAPAGEYVVTFTWPKEVPVKAKKPVGTDWGGPPDAPDYFGGAYADLNTSAFKVEIKAGPNKLEPFVLK